MWPMKRNLRRNSVLFQWEDWIIRRALHDNPSSCLSQKLWMVAICIIYHTYRGDEITNIICITKPATCVYGPVPTKLLFESRNIIISVITKTANMSLQTGLCSNLQSKTVYHTFSLEEGHHLTNAQSTISLMCQNWYSKP